MKFLICFLFISCSLKDEASIAYEKALTLNSNKYLTTQKKRMILDLTNKAISFREENKFKSLKLDIECTNFYLAPSSMGIESCIKLSKRYAQEGVKDANRLYGAYLFNHKPEKIKLAIKHFENELRLFPKNINALETLVSIYLFDTPLRDPKISLKYLNQLLKIDKPVKYIAKVKYLASTKKDISHKEIEKFLIDGSNDKCGVCALDLFNIYKDKNPTKAIRYLEKAARIGNVDAMQALVQAYDQGSLVKKDVNMVFKWLEYAHKSGLDIDSSYHLARMHIYQKYKLSSFDSGIKVLKELINENVYSAHYEAGLAYVISKGNQNPKLALFHAKEGLKNNSLPANILMSILYFYGNGVTKDNAKALEFLNNAKKGGLNFEGLEKYEQYILRTINERLSDKDYQELAYIIGNFPNLLNY